MVGSLILPLRAFNTFSMNVKTELQNLWKKPLHFVAYGFGSGLAPVAPGTFGTLAAVPIYLILSFLDLGWYLFFVTLFFALGIYLCQVVSEELGVHDHQSIVWDEIVGFLLTMAWVPLSFSTVFLGFILFRIFDILKPWPITLADEKMSNSLGIMLDDVLAAIYAGALLWIIWRMIL